MQMTLTTVKFPKPYRGWVSNQEGLEITDSTGKMYTFEGKGDFQIKFEPGKPIQITKNQHHCLPILQPKIPPREELLVLWQEGKIPYEIETQLSVDDYMWLMQQPKPSNTTTSNAPSVTSPKEKAPAKRSRPAH
jgi:hypothetical protein